MLTEQQRQDYINGPFRCPYCKSPHISSGKNDWDEPMGIRVECEDCGKGWTDILKVCDIVED